MIEDDEIYVSKDDSVRISNKTSVGDKFHSPLILQYLICKESKYFLNLK